MFKIRPDVSLLKPQLASFFKGKMFEEPGDIVMIILIVADVLLFIALCLCTNFCLCRRDAAERAHVALVDINELGEDLQKVVVVACPISEESKPSSTSS